MGAARAGLCRAALPGLPVGSGYLQDPAEAEAGVHELHEPEQQLQGVDVPVKAVPQVDVLYLHRARVLPPPPRPAPPPSLVDFPAGHHCFGPLLCKEGPTYLHSHSGAIMQPGTVHLGQAGSSDWLVVKFLKELVGRGLEVFKEQLVHLTGEGT